MAKAKNEIKEEEKKEVVTETTKKVEEPKAEVITSTGETAEELAGETVEKVADTNVGEIEDAKVEENASNEKEEAEVQVTEETKKVPTVKEVFRDKYDEKIVYKVGDIFIEDKEITGNIPVKVKDGQYKVSTNRYTELKRSLYVD